MKPCPELLPENEDNLELCTLYEGELAACHIYMEAQIFTPDSRCLVFHESAHAHGSDKDDPRHRYLLCDLAEDGALSPLTNETGATAPAISPDGRWFYYFVNKTEPNAGKLLLKRVRLDGRERETVHVLDHPIGPLNTRLSMPYPLSTIRSDGGAIAISGWLGDGETADAPWGLLVFDLEAGTADCILHGQSYCNLHPQYSRSTDTERLHDILVQENHGNRYTPAGEMLRLVGGAAGADIHVIRDDGTTMRDMPWGRDGNEHAQGHQCWRGQSNWAITSTNHQAANEWQLVESLPVAEQGHLGCQSAGAVHNELSRSFEGRSRFAHFATDLPGERLVTDHKYDEGGDAVFVATLGTPGADALSDWRQVAIPRCSWAKTSHVHPFLSPDGTMAFFNSDQSGILRPYLVRGLT